MPESVLTFVGLITGYLHGAGLGALFISFYPGASSQSDAQLVLIAVLILGPAGALAGLVLARAGSLVSDCFSGERQAHGQTVQNGNAVIPLK